MRAFRYDLNATCPAYLGRFRLYLDVVDKAELVELEQKAAFEAPELESEKMYFGETDCAVQTDPVMTQEEYFDETDSAVHTDPVMTHRHILESVFEPFWPDFHRVLNNKFVGCTWSLRHDISGISIADPGTTCSVCHITVIKPTLMVACNEDTCGFKACCAAPCLVHSATAAIHSLVEEALEVTFKVTIVT